LLVKEHLHTELESVKAIWRQGSQEIEEVVHGFFCEIFHFLAQKLLPFVIWEFWAAKIGSNFELISESKGFPVFFCFLEDIFLNLDKTGV